MDTLISSSVSKLPLRIDDNVIDFDVSVEFWSHGIVTARLKESSLYGDGPTIEAASENLQENIDEFLISVSTHCGAIGGQVLVDYNVLMSKS